MISHITSQHAHKMQLCYHSANRTHGRRKCGASIAGPARCVTPPLPPPGPAPPPPWPGVPGRGKTRPPRVPAVGIWFGRRPKNLSAPASEPPPIPAKLDRRIYADMFGPTAGDRVRLADTDLIIE